MDIIYLSILIGACGALAKIIIEEGALVLPTLKDGKLYLGGIGGIIIGAAAGYLADHDPLTMFCAGYAGTSLISYLVTKQGITQNSQTNSIEAQIRAIAKEELVDQDLAVRVAKCESNFNKNAVNNNTDGSCDRGIFQINNKYHPEVTDEQAFNIEFSTRFFCKAYKAGNLSWWNASKTCWKT